MSVLNTDKLINYYFEEISKIPRASYHEKGMADYIENLAKEHNLKYYRDEYNNIIVYKDASKGYEDHDILILQGHTDMVAEKNNDCHHNFDTDPLELYKEGDFLRARGTTLGADDGAGLCYMMAILTDDSLKHPPLECVFTVQEEVGLLGAFAIDEKQIHGRRMIGLDSENESNTYTSSSGGSDVLITKPFTKENNSDPVYTLEVKGLMGGHSGECINKARANANKLVGRILYHLLKNNIDIRITDITGGLKDNAIPRECLASFASSSSKEEILKVVNKCYNEIKGELEINDPDVEINLYNHEDENTCLNAKDSEDIIYILYLCINGMIELSQVIPGLTTLSLNMGILRTHEDNFTITYSLRSPVKSAKDELASQLGAVSNLFGATMEVRTSYPGWNYDPHSKLRKEFKAYYKEHTGKELVEIATHGGLETGIFKGKIPDLDIITYGPNMEYIHTPDEVLDLKSFEYVYDLLTGFIATL